MCKLYTIALVARVQTKFSSSEHKLLYIAFVWFAAIVVVTVAVVIVIATQYHITQPLLARSPIRSRV